MDQLITIDDEVGAILHALDTPEVSGPVNLVAPNPVTNADYASTLGKVLHRPTFIIPLFGPKLLFGSELAESLLKTSQRVSDGVLSATGYKFTHTNLVDALRSIIDAAARTGRRVSARLAAISRQRRTHPSGILKPKADQT